MSIRVELADLEAAVVDRGWAYFLTVRDDQRPHVVAVTPVWAGDAMSFEVGQGTGRNAASRSSVTLAFPPTGADGYTLIVDGEATVEPGEEAEAGPTRVVFQPTDAVLHRPAPSPPPS